MKKKKRELLRRDQKWGWFEIDQYKMGLFKGEKRPVCVSKSKREVLCLPVGS